MSRFTTASDTHYLTTTPRDQQTSGNGPWQHLAYRESPSPEPVGGSPSPVTIEHSVSVYQDFLFGDVIHVWFMFVESLVASGAAHNGSGGCHFF